MISDIVTVIMDLVFICFAIYGIKVFWEWHKAAEKIESTLDEMRKEMEGNQ